MQMDFGGLPLRDIIALGVFVGGIIYLARQTKQNEKAIKELRQTILHRDDRQTDRLDKLIGELRAEMNQRLSGLTAEMNQRLSGLTAEISKLNQNIFDLLNKDR